MCAFVTVVVFFNQKTAYEMRISDWSSDVCSSYLQDGPGLLALTRQNRPQLRLEKSENLCARGAYRLRAATASRNVVLLASGSEVELALGIADALEAQGIGADVVSMPCWSLFDAQQATYKADLLPSDALKVSIEAGKTFGWEQIGRAHV